MQRVAALGKNLSTKSTTAQALAIAQAGSKAFFDDQIFIDDHSIPLGAGVSITAESFGPEASVGTLIAATDNRYSIERTDPIAGELRVHFPRVGFVLKTASK
jgi:hypothetical protein